MHVHEFQKPALRLCEGAQAFGQGLGGQAERFCLLLRRSVRDGHARRANQREADAAGARGVVFGDGGTEAARNVTLFDGDEDTARSRVEKALVEGADAAAVDDLRVRAGKVGRSARCSPPRTWT